MSALSTCAFWFRQASAGLLMVCAARFSVLSVGAAFDAHAPTAEHEDEESSDGQTLEDPQAKTNERPDLRQLEQLLAQSKQREQLGSGEVLPGGEEDEPRARIRRILVDVGPPRSEVYVNGVFAGKTPYVGQVSCFDGSLVKVQVLPERGLPWFDELRCEGNALDAGTEEAGELVGAGNSANGEPPMEEATRSAVPLMQR